MRTSAKRKTKIRRIGSWECWHVVGVWRGHDPFNREDMISIGSDQKAVNHFYPKHPLYEFIAHLIQVRDKHPALGKGSLKVVLDNRAGPGLFAFC